MINLGSKNKEGIYWDDEYVPEEIELSEEDEERIKKQLQEKSIIE